MLHDTLGKIENKLRASSSLRDETRQELLDLVARLRGEMTEFSKTHSEQAGHIAGYTEASTEVATQQDRNPELLQDSLDKLAASVDGFEKSHPQLVQVVNRISTTLANLGI